MTSMLSGTKVLVTGASSGIGLNICKVLTSYGARVWGSGRNRGELEELLSEDLIEGYSVADLTDDLSDIEHFTLDIASPAEKTTNGDKSKDRFSSSDAGFSVCNHLVDESAKELDGLTAVVNAAGVLKGGAMGDVTIDNYDFNMNTNTRAPFEIMTHAIPHLKKAAADAAAQKSDDTAKCISPCIINISSVNGKQSFPGCISYCMSKAAVDMMTRCASVDLAKYGIRVNSVNPGMVVTNLQKRGGLSDDQYESFLSRQVEVTHPLGAYLGRCGTPEEVGELVAFLLSDKAQFITGECIAMDGGRQNLGSR